MMKQNSYVSFAKITNVVNVKDLYTQIRTVLNVVLKAAQLGFIFVAPLSPRLNILIENLVCTLNHGTAPIVQ